VGAAMVTPSQDLYRKEWEEGQLGPGAALGSVRAWGGLSRTHHAGPGVPWDQALPACC
jgi:hypothetical protein